jgi:hypothetical protein
MMVACEADRCLDLEATCVNGWCAVNGGAEGAPCNTDQQCADGLTCCYPCGQAGCNHACAQPYGQTGVYPMYPEAS